MFELLFKNGACANVINPVSRTGFLLQAMHFAIEQIMDNAKDLADVDPNTGFNAIHNIVSGQCTCRDFSNLTSLIEVLMEEGCELDHQDVEGNTRWY